MLPVSNDKEYVLSVMLLPLTIRLNDVALLSVAVNTDFDRSPPPLEPSEGANTAIDSVNSV